MATVKVLLKRGIYYYDELPDGTFTKNPVPHPAGKIISMRAKDVSELAGKVERVKDDPRPGPPPVTPAGSDLSAVTPAQAGKKTEEKTESFMQKEKKK